MTSTDTDPTGLNGTPSMIKTESSRSPITSDTATQAPTSTFDVTNDAVEDHGPDGKFSGQAIDQAHAAAVARAASGNQPEDDDSEYLEPTLPNPSYECEPIYTQRPWPVKPSGNRILKFFAWQRFNAAVKLRQDAATAVLVEAQDHFDTPNKIALLSDKGGVGKTTASVVLTKTTADNQRSIQVVVAGADSNTGTLSRMFGLKNGINIKRLGNDELLPQPQIDTGPKVIKALGSDPKSGGFVAASQNNLDSRPPTATQIEAGSKKLSHYFGSIIYDLGINLSDPATKWVIHHTDVIVIVSDGTEESIDPVGKLILSLLNPSSDYHPDILRKGVLLINRVSDAQSKDAEYMKLRYAKYFGAVCIIGSDPGLSGRDNIHEGNHSKLTAAQIAEFAAAVASCMRVARPLTPDRQVIAPIIPDSLEWLDQMRQTKGKQPAKAREPRRLRPQLKQSAPDVAFIEPTPDTTSSTPVMDTERVEKMVQTESAAADEANNGAQTTGLDGFLSRIVAHASNGTTTGGVKPGHPSANVEGHAATVPDLPSTVVGRKEATPVVTVEEEAPPPAISSLKPEPGKHYVFARGEDLRDIARDALTAHYGGRRPADDEINQYAEAIRRVRRNRPLLTADGTNLQPHTADAYLQLPLVSN